MPKVIKKVIHIVEFDEDEFETILQSLDNLANPSAKKISRKRQANILLDAIIVELDKLH